MSLSTNVYIHLFCRFFIDQQPVYDDMPGNRDKGRLEWLYGNLQQVRHAEAGSPHLWTKSGHETAEKTDSEGHRPGT